MSRIPIYIIPLLILFSCNQKEPLPLTPELVLQRSIDYHDPQGNWPVFKGIVSINAIVRDQPRKSQVYSNKKENHFIYHDTLESFGIIYETQGDTICEVQWQKPNQSEEEKEKINCSRAQMYRDYFNYLIGVPMVLNNKKAIVTDSLMQEDVNGKMHYKLQVRYEPFEENPNWYFYFDPESYALVQSKFAWLPDEKRGEIIQYDNLVNFQQMKLQTNQRWINISDGDTIAVEQITYSKVDHGYN